MFKKDGKFVWCWKCFTGFLLVVSFTILFIFMFIKIGSLRANAEELLISQFSSVETRSRVLELLSEGRLIDGTEKIIKQGNNQNFLVRSKEAEAGLEIYIIPEVNGVFNFPYTASWLLLFDANNQLLEVKYYFTESELSYILARSYQNSMEFTLVLHNETIYENITIPLSIRNFIKMPFEDFIAETQQVLHWEWIFPSNSFKDVNSRSANFANFLQDKIKKLLGSMMITYKLPQDAENIVEYHQLLVLELIEKINFINDVIKEMLRYIGSGNIDTNQFLPTDSNNNRITYSDTRFTPAYTNKVLNFLKLYPDFYTSISVVDLPFNYDVKNTLSSLYAKLYMMTAKFPGLWYIVPIIKSENQEEKLSETYVGIDILIPYFNPNGKFEILGFDAIENYLAEENTNISDSKQYFYELEILRVPNRRNNALE